MAVLRLNTFQSLSDKTLLYSDCAEMLEHFSQRRPIDPYRQIAVTVKFRPCLH